MVKPINRSAPIHATSTITSNHHRLLFAVVGLLSVVAVSSDIPVVVEDEQSAVEQETVLKGLYRLIISMKLASLSVSKPDLSLNENCLISPILRNGRSRLIFLS